MLYFYPSIISFLGTDVRIVHVRTGCKYCREMFLFFSDTRIVGLINLITECISDGNLLHFSPPAHQYSARIIPHQRVAGKYRSFKSAYDHDEVHEANPSWVQIQ